jgi:putative FmdB family regulatory protein
MDKSASKNATGTAMPLWKGSSMPIYEFKCDKCEAIKDVAIGFHKPKEVTCDNCGVLMWRVWTPTPTHFKGDGWASKTK